MWVICSGIGLHQSCCSVLRHVLQKSHHVFFCYILHQLSRWSFPKSNSPSKWILRIPVHQVLHQSFSLVRSSLSVTCLSAAQNSVWNASLGNVIKDSWENKLTQGSTNRELCMKEHIHTALRDLSLFQMLVYWVVYRKEVKFHTLSFYDRLIWTCSILVFHYVLS